MFLIDKKKLLNKKNYSNFNDICILDILYN